MNLKELETKAKPGTAYAMGFQTSEDVRQSAIQAGR